MTVVARTLTSGLRVVLAPRPDAGVTAVVVTVGAGSRADPPGRAGVAHLVEHLMFRPRGTAADHLQDVHRAGGLANATTDVDHTEFYTLVPAGMVASVLDLEGRRFGGLGVSAGAVEHERRIVAHEIDEALNRSRGGFPWLVLPPTLFGPRAETRPPHGDCAELAEVTVADCRAYLARHYVAPNVVVTVVGAFSVDPVLERIAQRFADLPAGTSAYPERTDPPAGVRPGRVVHAARHARGGADLRMTAVGFPTPDPGGDPGAYLDVVFLARILSNHHLPALLARHPTLVEAAMRVGVQGRFLHRRAPDLAVCQMVGLADGSADAADPDALVLRALDYIREHDVTPSQRRRAANGLALAHHNEVDDPLAYARALGRREALGFGWRSLPDTGAVLAAAAGRPLRPVAGRLLDGGRAVVRLHPVSAG